MDRLGMSGATSTPLVVKEAVILVCGSPDTEMVMTAPAPIKEQLIP
jgi:hypothetical protein